MSSAQVSFQRLFQHAFPQLASHSQPKRAYPASFLVTSIFQYVQCTSVFPASVQHAFPQLASNSSPKRAYPASFPGDKHLSSMSSAQVSFQRLFQHAFPQLASHSSQSVHTQLAFLVTSIFPKKASEGILIKESRSISKAGDRQDSAMLRKEKALNGGSRTRTSACSKKYNRSAVVRADEDVEGRGSNWGRREVAGSARAGVVALAQQLATAAPLDIEEKVLETSAMKAKLNNNESRNAEPLVRENSIIK
eukprot:gene18537-25044_t